MMRAHVRKPPCLTAAPQDQPLTSHTVLLVDDEPNLLAGLSRALRREPYELLCASSVDDAFVFLMAKPVDIVISDQDMPDMRGTVFLARVRQQFPDTVRFMLTGKATLEVAMQAINDGAISRFLTKPCNPVDLAMTIRQALQQKDLLEASRRLLHTVKRQSATLEWLEHQHPGITQVRRDMDGAIIAEPEEMSIDAFVHQLRREAARGDAGLDAWEIEPVRNVLKGI
jgi:two-component system probable response regulator PhcQ